LNFRLMASAAFLSLAACSQSAENDRQEQVAAAANPELEALRFADARPSNEAFQAPPSMIVEVALDRMGFSPGVIDGKPTRLDEQALRGFQEAKGLPVTGKLDQQTREILLAGQTEPTRLVTIPEGFAKGPFAPDLPKETSKQAGFDHLSYRDMTEALAERFHTTPETLGALNPAGTKLSAGATIRVPNIAPLRLEELDTDDGAWNRTLATLGVAARQPRAEKVVVSKSQGTLRAYDAAGKLLAQFPVTTGSEHDPLPLGNWKINGVSRNPDYHYNPKLFWDVSDNKEDKLLKPGPNGPVGVAWLDLSKEHYGIHGTSEPATIGSAESHGCVRLTNWDAARLAQMVKAGTKVVFEA